MSKNLTRKGLAFGALLALGATVIAGAPASAATTPLGSAITVSATGTGSTVIEGTDFDVTTAIASDYAYYNSTTGDFTATPTDQYNVCILWTEDPASGDQADYCVDSETQTLTVAEANATVHAENYWTDPGVLSRITNRWASTTGSLQWTVSDVDGNVDAYNDSAATFSVDPIAADKSITFTPYLDVNGVSGYQNGEPTGAGKSVTFANNTQQLVDALSTSITGTVNADVNYAVTAPAGYNIKQMADDLEVRLYRASTEIGDPSLDITGAASFGNYGTGYYTSRVFANGGSSSAAYSALSNQVIVGQVSTDTKITGIEHVDQADANVTRNEDIRENTKSVSVKAQILNADGAYAHAGTPVKFVVTPGSNNVDTVIKVNGVAIPADGTIVTTNASGIAEITVSSTTGKAGDSFSVVAYVLTESGFQNTGLYCELVTYNWVDAVARHIYETHDTSYNTESPVGVVKGGTVTLNYEVTDNFGQPLSLPGESFRVVVTDGHHHVLVSAPALVVNGKATVSYQETRNAGDNYDVTAELERSVDGSNWYSDVHCIEKPEANIFIGTTSTVGSVSATVSSGDKYINTDTFFNLKEDLVDWANQMDVSSDDWTPEASHEITVSGYAVDANNVPIAGAPVQIALSRGGWFEVETWDEDLFSTSTVTVYTDANGYYSVEFATHYAGDNLVTVTSGGKTATATATVLNPTDAHSTDVLTVTPTAGLLPGAVVPVSAKIVDKFGNGVKGLTINFAAAGIGYLTSATGTTDANGVATTSVVTSPAQPGSAVVTATVASLTTKTATGTVVVATPEPAAKVNVVGKRVYVKFSNSRGEEVSAVIGGVRITKIAAFDNYVLSRIIKKAGKYAVKAYVAGDLVKASTVTIK